MNQLILKYKFKHEVVDNHFVLENEMVDENGSLKCIMWIKI